MAKISDAASEPHGHKQLQAAAPDRATVQLIRPQRFVPVEHAGEMADAPHNAKLTVDLGGETMRCLVRLVADDDTVVVEIIGVCQSKSHGFRQGDFVAARRRRHMNGGDAWVATGRSAIDEAHYARLADERRRRLDKEQVTPPKRRRDEQRSR